jgi:drug/metabolite transporter (DMT)-like permease
VLCYAGYTVLLRRGPGEDAVVTAATTCAWGLVFLVPWLAWEVVSGAGRMGFGPEVIAALLHLGVPASALTVLLWSYGAARVAGSASGAFTAAIPAVGYLFAVLAGEAPTWPKTVGSVLAVAGTVLSASGSRSR